MKLLKFFFFLILLLAAYLLLWPTPLTPVAWTPDPIPSEDSLFKSTRKIPSVEVLFSGACQGCEDVAVDASGKVYGGSDEGRIKVFDSWDDQVGFSLTYTGGRPLGLHFDGTKNLWVCDAEEGLLKIDPNGTITKEVATYENKPLRFANDLDITREGIVYFTDASTKYNLQNYKLDLIEHRPLGRLFRYDPKTKVANLIQDQLYFANGVALSPEEEYVLVCETGAYRIRKIWLRGPKRGQSEVILDNLPGYPDGISRGTNGIYWCPLVSPRKAYLEKLYDKPLAMKMISRIPKALQPAPGREITLLGINGEGKLIHVLRVDNPSFSRIASVQEAYGQLFLGSLSDNGIGRIPLPN